MHTLACKHTSCISDKHTCAHANIRTHEHSKQRRAAAPPDRACQHSNHKLTYADMHANASARTYAQAHAPTHERPHPRAEHTHTRTHTRAHIHTHKYTTTVTVFSARDCCICGGAQLLLQIQCGEINQTATQVRECDIGSDLCVRWKKSEPQLKICTFSWKKQQHNSCCTPNKWWCSVWEKEKLIKLPLRARSFVCVRRKKS